MAASYQARCQRGHSMQVEHMLPTRRRCSTQLDGCNRQRKIPRGCNRRAAAHGPKAVIVATDARCHSAEVARKRRRGRSKSLVQLGIFYYCFIRSADAARFGRGKCSPAQPAAASRCAAVSVGSVSGVADVGPHQPCNSDPALRHLSAAGC